MRYRIYHCNLCDEVTVIKFNSTVDHDPCNLFGITILLISLLVT
jgi:hypothetical protein